MYGFYVKTGFSIPSDSTKTTATKVVNAEKFKISLHQNVAHFDSFLSPRGDKLHQVMNKLISISTSGQRWYVSYYVSIEGKNVRKRVYGRVNVEKDLTKRMRLLLELQRSVYNSLLKNNDPLEKRSLTPDNICKICDNYIEDKKLYVKFKTYKTIKRHLGTFQKWLIETNNANKQPCEFIRNDLLDFRNHLLKKGMANRTVNNAMTELTTMFNFIIDSESYGHFVNPITKIKRLPSRSEMHVSYTTEQFQKMFDYMKEHDPYLLFFIKIIAFSYMRIDEAKAIRIGDIDLEARKITLSAKENKTNDRTYKIIQELIIDEFERLSLSEYPPNYFLFSKNEKPGPEPLYEEYFRRRFKKIKDKFGLTRHHTIYGFRHTSVSQLLESGVKWHKAMDLTGHRNMSSFQQYARSVLGRQPEDHSSSYTVKL